MSSGSSAHAAVLSDVVTASPATLEPQVIDFFSGCGGTSAGLQTAGMQIIAALDLDAAAAATFRANFPGADFVQEDIRAVDPTTFDALIDPGRALVFSACAPCQPYSSLRRGKRAHEDRSLLLQILPFVERHSPDAVIVENVPGMQKVPAASTWNRFRAFLTRLGYHHSWQVVDARDYGVPQRRRRLVLVASKHGPIELPEPTHGPGRKPYATVGEWIGDLPALEAGATDPIDPAHSAGVIGDLNLRRLRATPQGGGRSGWPADLWLNCHKDFTGHADVYGRLALDRWAPVLTTKCTDITAGRFGHPTQDRAITVREAALLQTFPRDFVFIGKRKSTSRQVGNAVPVLLARAVGEQVLSHLGRQQGQT